MTSVAHELRAETAARLRALSPLDRIELAPALGDADADLFARANGVTLAEARERLRESRFRGRRPSRCADPGR